MILVVFVAVRVILNAPTVIKAADALLASVSVPAVEVTIKPLTEEGVIAPRENVACGVVVAFVTDADTPFAVATEKVVTVPVPVMRPHFTPFVEDESAVKTYPSEPTASLFRRFDPGEANKSPFA